MYFFSIESMQTCEVLRYSGEPDTEILMVCLWTVFSYVDFLSQILNRNIFVKTGWNFLCIRFIQLLKPLEGFYR